MKKILNLIIPIFLLLLLSGCSNQSTNFPDSSQSIIANDDYIAFFDNDNNVVIIDYENGMKTLSCENPIIAIYDAENLIVLKLQNGKYILHDPQKEIVSMDNYWDKNWSDNYKNLFHIISNNSLDKLYIVSPSCVYGLSINGEPIGNENLFLHDFPTKIIGTAFPEYSLDAKGHIHVFDDANQTDFWTSEIESWQNIVDIALGLVPFALTNDGKILTTVPSSYNAAEVTSWDGIKQISAKPFSTAALTNDGNVKICSSYADIYEAQNWENVAYIQMSESYFLGVTADGDLLLTPFGTTRFHINDIQCPKVKLLK